MSFFHSLPHPGLISLSTFGVSSGIVRNLTNKEYESHPKNHQKNPKWVLTNREIRSLIVSALIFLSVFAWADVLASYYRSCLINKTNDKLPEISQLAGVLPPRFPHNMSKDLVSRTADFDVWSKMKYAILLSFVTILVFFLLSIT